MQLFTFCLHGDLIKDHYRNSVCVCSFRSCFNLRKRRRCPRGRAPLRPKTYIDVQVFSPCLNTQVLQKNTSPNCRGCSDAPDLSPRVLAAALTIPFSSSVQMRQKTTVLEPIPQFNHRNPYGEALPA